MLCQLGFKKIVSVGLDHAEVYSYKVSPDSLDDLEESIAVAKEDLGSPEKQIPNKVDLGAVRRTHSFHEYLSASYSKKHDPDKLALMVYVQIAPIDVVCNKSESLTAFEIGLDTKYSRLAKTVFLGRYNKLLQLFPLS